MRALSLMLETYRYGHQFRVGLHHSTVLADFDFETYSEAGYVWNEAAQKWDSPAGCSAQKRGLGAVGVENYVAHPTFAVLTLYYDLKDGCGRRNWRPGYPVPQDLFDHIASGLILEAHNAAFERRVWRWMVANCGWPVLPDQQLQCTMAKARAYTLPGGLDKAAEVLGTPGKDKAGTALMNMFSMPVKPTKKNGGKKRILPTDEPAEFEKYVGYNERDIYAESWLSAHVPDLLPIELEYWHVDQTINNRGVHMDMDLVYAIVKILAQAEHRYGLELEQLTGGIGHTKNQQLQGWFAARGFNMSSLDDEHITAALTTRQPPPLDDVRRVLEIKQLLASSSVKKVYNVVNQVTQYGRLHDLFLFHKTRTGRPTGTDVQPTNLPKAGPNVWRCVCTRHYGASKAVCPWCGKLDRRDKRGNVMTEPQEWTPEAMDDAILVIALGSLATVEKYFDEPLSTIAGCLRGLFVASPGNDLISSDYTSIEAVVLACIAGEQWRINLFRNKGKIYEASGAKIKGITYEEVLAYKERTGYHHPARATGKVGELANGYQGWISAYRNFDKDPTIHDDTIKENILRWRAESPAIVELWGGQSRREGRGLKWERYGVEGAFIDAILNPGVEYDVKGLKFICLNNTVYITLYSGRRLVYHDVSLRPSDRYGNEYSIHFWGWNDNAQRGPTNRWIEFSTWGGRLVENIVQAVSNDILRFASVNCEKAGYAIVLHVYDEITADVPKGFGDIDNFEAWMAWLPLWCVLPDGTPWPIFVAGGWRGFRYRKA